MLFIQGKTNIIYPGEKKILFCSRKKKSCKNDTGFPHHNTDTIITT
jgi:hypothetical protein